jgi:2-polyprenyl-6-methoxyphenol hydroxylase-like FAD-dependent oxidoreductase
MKNKSVLISGAGLAGLTVAYWLKRYGFVPTLVERHPALRTGGYKIDIRGVALDVVKRMGVYPSIFDSRCDILEASFVDSAGKVVTEMSADLCGSRAEGDVEIMRGDLCQILLQQVSDVECLYGDSIAQISESKEGVQVAFERNKPRQFDLVVGADGLHSMVRKLAFGDESQFLKELGIYISVFTIPNFLNLDRREIEFHAPQKFVNLYSMGTGLDAKAGFAFASKPLRFDPRNTEQQQKLLEEVFAGLGWEVPRIFSSMRQAPDFYFDAAAQIHMPHWTKGRIALIGDAGYAPSPLSGQGTSLALVGAYVLAGELFQAHGDHTKAFSQYEKVLHSFVKKNQKLVSMGVQIMTGSDSSFIAWLHRHLLRLMPESWIQFLKKQGLKRVSVAANSLTLKNYIKIN